MYIVLSQGSASFLLSLPDLPQLGQTFNRKSPFPTQKTLPRTAQKVRRAVLVMPAPTRWLRRLGVIGINPNDPFFRFASLRQSKEFEIWGIPMIFRWFSYDIPNIGPDVFGSPIIPIPSVRIPMIWNRWFSYPTSRHWSPGRCTTAPRCQTPRDPEHLMARFSVGLNSPNIRPFSLGT